ncbi:nitrogenase-stabilizing/protective protein NifW [Euhalothece natronophila Z-M001]|uniref:Nitrogenase-stabilizing/protective protein NifW n=1 Tax=Euhalothece natronophila Z-M001 TaxID=522448 RepID=A0A5B8NIQ0_9CHRO|nr:nitrogenase-stabilizing/protective protein NifW [Euhalothece natronophila]QDZ38847.1 nitrogenase-stabilizing/protective protein NifW [Euhalothece natronophila Z-M001]
MTTTKTLADFQKLTTAEDYLQFFEIDYDQQFVNINRLHILKQFSLLIKEVDEAFPDVSEEEKLEKYGMALAEAYEVFLTSSPLETKLFKVFQNKPKNFVSVNDLTPKE